MKLFVTGTGTGVGKSWVTEALVRCYRSDGLSVAAVKPIETGCEPEPEDARRLGLAAERPELANHPGFVRGTLPLSPWGAELEGEPPVPATEALVEVIRSSTQGADVRIAEGAGGPLVPIDRDRDVADLMVALGWPVLLVGLDGLGTLSHSLTAHEALSRRGLRVAGLVLTKQSAELSQGTNRQILAARLPCPVWSVGPWTSAEAGVGEVRDVAAALRDGAE
ncbi:MAG: dethiobiotin synthase [Deltaproteobacteria bacterium]|nr:dethiobiotin synthase [Deltaproteobacteria bacterium]